MTSKSCVPRLEDVALGVNFGYDPTTPTQKEISFYGVINATERSRTSFLHLAVRRIRFDCPRGYEECCRKLAFFHSLAIPLEQGIFVDDILIRSSFSTSQFHSHCLRIQLINSSAFETMLCVYWPKSIEKLPLS